MGDKEELQKIRGMCLKIVKMLDGIESGEDEKKEKERREIKRKCLWVVEFWNMIAEEGGLPKIKGLTSGRIKTITARMKEYSEDDIRRVLSSPRTSEFLSSGGKWSPTFDWFLKPSNFAKVIEGNYSNRVPVVDDDGTGEALEKMKARHGGQR